ncbi:hypothetical protein BV22DRAFT_1037253 [Leucogyrophana mollusca]|uniref:Uncharacterized protein n=1 Tax=Leucogyrophana mollusca TaxID=85980 RepID=A0ACB8BAM2_9AGAM|nr:hypothetical protein BV22DRAFT_1037253 [Leucogyrophana mollusca]
MLDSTSKSHNDGIDSASMEKSAMKDEEKAQIHDGNAKMLTHVLTAVTPRARWALEDVQSSRLVFAVNQCSGPLGQSGS